MISIGLLFFILIVIAGGTGNESIMMFSLISYCLYFALTFINEFSLKDFLFLIIIFFLFLILSPLLVPLLLLYIIIDNDNEQHKKAIYWESNWKFCKKLLDIEKEKNKNV